MALDSCWVNGGQAKRPNGKAANLPYREVKPMIFHDGFAYRRRRDEAEKDARNYDGLGSHGQEDATSRR